MGQQSLNLFGEDPQIVRKAIEPPPFDVKLKYQCLEPHCKGHAPGILDWELTAMQHRMVREGRSEEEIKARIRRNFLEKPFASVKSPALYLGNQANPTKRRNFSVLGIYYPGATDLPQRDLFDEF